MFCSRTCFRVILEARSRPRPGGLIRHFLSVFDLFATSKISCSRTLSKDFAQQEYASSQLEPARCHVIKEALRASSNAAFWERPELPQDLMCKSSGGFTKCSLKLFKQEFSWLCRYVNSTRLNFQKALRNRTCIVRLTPRTFQLNQPLRRYWSCTIYGNENVDLEKHQAI